VRFDNASYTITVAAGGTVCIANLHSGLQYVAWDPPPAADGAAPAYSFWGDTTLTLEDGTKVTIHTAPGQDTTVRWTRPEQVVITSGGYGVEVHGLGGGGAALGFVETTVLGWLLDAVVPDGALLQECTPAGGLVGNDPGGLWTTVAPQDVAPALLAALGPLALAAAATPLSAVSMQLAGGVVAVTFMGSFRGAPAFELYGGDEPAAPQSELRRLSDNEEAHCRLLVSRDGPHHLRWAAAGRGWGAP